MRIKPVAGFQKQWGADGQGGGRRSACRGLAGAWTKPPPTRLQVSRLELRIFQVSSWLVNLHFWIWLKMWAMETKAKSFKS